MDGLQPYLRRFLHIYLSKMSLKFLKSKSMTYCQIQPCAYQGLLQKNISISETAYSSHFDGKLHSVYGP